MFLKIILSIGVLHIAAFASDLSLNESLIDINGDEQHTQTIQSRSHVETNPDKIRTRITFCRKTSEFLVSATTPAMYTFAAYTAYCASTEKDNEKAHDQLMWAMVGNILGAVSTTASTFLTPFGGKIALATIAATSFFFWPLANISTWYAYGLLSSIDSNGDFVYPEDSRIGTMVYLSALGIMPSALASYSGYKFT